MEIATRKFQVAGLAFGDCEGCVAVDLQPVLASIEQRLTLELFMVDAKGITVGEVVTLTLGREDRHT
jgi:hypothetical protein